MLNIQKISKSYANKEALQDISFNIPTGSIFGLLGPNGAGKTTLIRIITGIVGADSGQITFYNNNQNAKLSIRDIGYMPEERGLYKKMRVGEQLLYLARLKGLSKIDAKNRLDAWLQKFAITDWWNKKIEELSKGMQQKIQFIATVIHEPKLIILDEPFSGLDPINSDLIKKEIYQLKKSGTTILFSTHRMEQVEEICEHITLINNGKNILSGRVNDIKQQFKKNEFAIHFTDKKPILNPEKYTIIEDNGQYLQFQMKTETGNNQLLQEIMSSGTTVLSFTEVLPSLNDIFVEQVSLPNE